MILDNGIIQFSEANEHNIPVNLTLSQINHPEDTQNHNKWKLTAHNYMPRKHDLDNHEIMYEALADAKQELVDLLITHVQPIYQQALNTINKIRGQNQTLDMLSLVPKYHEANAPLFNIEQINCPNCQNPNSVAQERRVTETKQDLMKCFKCDYLWWETYTT
jgi:hypothetical protein